MTQWVSGGGGGGYARAENVSLTPGETFWVDPGQNNQYVAAPANFKSESFLKATPGQNGQHNPQTLLAEGGEGGEGSGSALTFSSKGGKGGKGKYNNVSGVLYPSGGGGGGGAAGPDRDGGDGGDGGANLNASPYLFSGGGGGGAGNSGSAGNGSNYSGLKGGAGGSNPTGQAGSSGGSSVAMGGSPVAGKFTVKSGGGGGGGGGGAAGGVSGGVLRNGGGGARSNIWDKYPTEPKKSMAFGGGGGGGSMPEDDSRFGGQGGTSRGWFGGEGGYSRSPSTNPNIPEDNSGLVLVFYKPAIKGEGQGQPGPAKTTGSAETYTASYGQGSLKTKRAKTTGSASRRSLASGAIMARKGSASASATRTIPSNPAVFKAETAGTQGDALREVLAESTLAQNLASLSGQAQRVIQTTVTLAAGEVEMEMSAQWGADIEAKLQSQKAEGLSGFGFLQRRSSGDLSAKEGEVGGAFQVIRKAEGELSGQVPSVDGVAEMFPLHKTQGMLKSLRAEFKAKAIHIPNRKAQGSLIAGGVALEAEVSRKVSVTVRLFASETELTVRSWVRMYPEQDIWIKQ